MIRLSLNARRSFWLNSKVTDGPVTRTVTPKELLYRFRRQAGAAGISDLELRVLLGHALDLDQAGLIARSGCRLDGDQIAVFTSLVHRRTEGVPVSYLTGTREFWSLPIRVNPHVLIPRHQTECVVERVLAHTCPAAKPGILELGTGSGAISLALASELPSGRIIATDISAEALEVAGMNQRRLGLDNIRFVRNDWFDGLGAREFEVICSNPPYIDPKDRHLDSGDVRFEPRIALVAEDSGYADLEHIIGTAPRYLAEHGWLVLEHGYRQGETVRAIFNDSGYRAVTTHLDLEGNERVTEGRYSG